MRRRQLQSNIVVRAAFIFVVVFLIFSVINMQFELRELRSEREALEGTVYRLEESIAELEIRYNTPQSDKYWERLAREKLGLKYSDERVFVNDRAS